jgi:hypothetical protein
MRARGKNLCGDLAVAAAHVQLEPISAR